jgi:hypothetical protein
LVIDGAGTRRFKGGGAHNRGRALGRRSAPPIYPQRNGERLAWPWTKLDDGFPDHPKVAGLSDRAFRAFITGVSYSSRFLTDGKIPKAIVPNIAKPATRAELCKAELWHDADDGGVEIHDFLDYNPPRDEVEELRRKRSEAGRLGGLHSGEARRQPKAQASASRSLEAKSNPSPVQSSPSPFLRG